MYTTRFILNIRIWYRNNNNKATLEPPREQSQTMTLGVQTHFSSHRLGPRFITTASLILMTILACAIRSDNQPLIYDPLSLCNFFYSMKFCSANTKNWISIFKNSFWICMVIVKLGGTQLAVLHSTYQSFLGSWFLSTKHSQILMSIAVPCSHRL